jgi:hypothetical protein
MPKSYLKVIFFIPGNQNQMKDCQDDDFSHGISGYQNRTDDASG